MPQSIVRPSLPDDDQARSIRALIAAVAGEDGRVPLSDQALTHIGSPAVDHALVLDDGRLTGYGQLDGRSLEIAAEPGAIGALLDAYSDHSVLVWAHGQHSRLTPALAERGFVPQRELHQLRRPLAEPITVPPVPAGVQIRPFVPGTDEDAQVGVNAAAFATHAEQGNWTRADLEAREREPWFDPAGFLMAWRGAELLGFHWTKVHPGGEGEVYVIGVAPAAQGLGLGDVLLLSGLVQLRTRGCPEVLLYVDASNTGAFSWYERRGFRRHDLDVQWHSP